MNNVFTKHLNKLKEKYCKHQYINYEKLKDITLYSEHYNDGFYIIAKDLEGKENKIKLFPIENAFYGYNSIYDSFKSIINFDLRRSEVGNIFWMDIFDVLNKYAKSYTKENDDFCPCEYRFSQMTYKLDSGKYSDKLVVLAEHSGVKITETLYPTTIDHEGLDDFLGSMYNRTM